MSVALQRDEPTDADRADPNDLLLPGRATPTLSASAGEVEITVTVY